MKYLKTHSLADAAGVTMSIVCLLHCLTVPIVLLVCAAAGIAVPWKEDETHRVFALVLIFIASIAIVQGVRGHGRRLPAFLILLGMAGICVAGFLHDDDTGSGGLLTMLTMLSSAVLVAGHVMNREGPACTTHQSCGNSPSI